MSGRCLLVGTYPHLRVDVKGCDFMEIQLGQHACTCTCIAHWPMLALPAADQAPRFELAPAEVLLPAAGLAKQPASC